MERFDFSFDAFSQATWRLWAALKAKLEATPWRGVGDDMRGTLWDCYERYYQPFGELLTDMERAGMLVDTDHLAKMEQVSCQERRCHVRGAQ